MREWAQRIYDSAFSTSACAVEVESISAYSWVVLAMQS